MVRNKQELNSIILVYKDEPYSPRLVTTREYGRWFNEVFGNTIGDMELKMKSRTKGGNTLLESHPGTRIGSYFDKSTFSDANLKCWYIDSESRVLDKIYNLELATAKDLSKKDGKCYLRLYTTEQIEAYLKSLIDRNFTLRDYVKNSYQVRVSTYAYESEITKPESTVINKKRKLF